jgi:hypothetical protein
MKKVHIDHCKKNIKHHGTLLNTTKYCKTEHNPVAVAGPYTTQNVIVIKNGIIKNLISIGSFVIMSSYSYHYYYYDDDDDDYDYDDVVICPRMLLSVQALL